MSRLHINLSEMHSTRRLSQIFFAPAIKEGWSGNRLLKLLREKGISYRTQDFYRDWRAWREMLDTWSKAKYYHYDYKIPENMYVESDKYKRAKYTTYVHVRYYDTVRGEWIERELAIEHLHEFQGHLLPDITQDYTKHDMAKAVQKVLRDKSSIEAENIQVIPLYGFVNPNW
jgi:hypothetical protein